MHSERVGICLIESLPAIIISTFITHRESKDLTKMQFLTKYSINNCNYFTSYKTLPTLLCKSLNRKDGQYLLKK